MKIGRKLFGRIFETKFYHVIQTQNSPKNPVKNISENGPLIVNLSFPIFKLNNRLVKN